MIKIQSSLIATELSIEIVFGFANLRIGQPYHVFIVHLAAILIQTCELWKNLRQALIFLVGPFLILDLVLKFKVAFILNRGDWIALLY